MLKTQSLQDIWTNIRSRYFRVRHLPTLEDYLAVEIAVWTRGLPYFINLLKCNESAFKKYQCDAFIKSWVLLSNRSEIDYLKTLGNEEEIAFKIKYFYRQVRV